VRPGYLTWDLPPVESVDSGECRLRSSYGARVGARNGSSFTPVGLSHCTRGTRAVPYDPPDVCGGAISLPASSDVAPAAAPTARRGAQIGAVQ
jgi:hypothetical protein